MCSRSAKAATAADLPPHEFYRRHRGRRRRRRDPLNCVVTTLEELEQFITSCTAKYTTIRQLPGELLQRFARALDELNSSY